MTTILQQLLLQVILISANAFFAATEIALISLNELKVRRQADHGDKKAKKLLRIVEEPTSFLSTIQIGITLAGFLASAFAADNFSEPIVQWLVDTVKVTAISSQTLDTMAVILITLILSYFTLVFGELVPKRVAMRHTEGLARKVSGIIYFLSKALKPIVWALSASTNGILRLMRINPKEEDAEVSEEDILDMIGEGTQRGTIQWDTGEMIENVFAFDDVTAEEIMVPRTRMSVISLTDTKETILQTIRSTGFSRIPVYGKNIDDIHGILRVKDYLLAAYREEEIHLKEMILPVHYVPETIRANVLFREMQKSKAHIVIVADEYGGTAGMITLEDLIEEILGDIYDENEVTAKANVLKISENRWKIAGQTEMEQITEILHLEDVEADAFHTFGGWLLSKQPFLPVKDLPPEIILSGYRFKVLSMDKKQVQWAEVTRIEETEQKSPSAPSIEKQ